MVERPAVKEVVFDQRGLKGCLFPQLAKRLVVQPVGPSQPLSSGLSVKLTTGHVPHRELELAPTLSGTGLGLNLPGAAICSKGADCSSSCLPMVLMGCANGAKVRLWGAL